LNDANDHWNSVFRKIRHGNIFGSFLWGYLGVLFPNGTTKDGIPTPKSTPPTASVVSPPAWCNYLKWKMTPLPWCRVDSGEASCSHLGFFWVVHLAEKTLSHHYLESFLWGRNPNLNPTTHRNNIEYLDKPTKSLLPKTKKGEGDDLFKKKMFATKTW